MGRNRALIVLGIAIVIALIASVSIYAWLQRKAAVRQMVSVESQTENVAVATKDLPWGTLLSADMIREAPFLKSSLPAGSFSTSSALIGRVIIFPVKANEPILESRLAPKTITAGGVAAVVSPKKRATAIRVDKYIGVSGFIHPGNRVDVLVTLASGRVGAPVSITKTVLENILVLAIGPEIQTAKGKEEKPSPTEVITLEVTPEEAEKLGLASNEGRLQLVLRNYIDTEDVLTRGSTVPAMLASYSLSAQGKETKGAGGKSKGTLTRSRPAPEKKTVFVVEVIKGGKVSEVKFEGRE